MGAVGTRPLGCLGLLHRPELAGAHLFRVPHRTSSMSSKGLCAADRMTCSSKVSAEVRPCTVLSGVSGLAMWRKTLDRTRCLLKSFCCGRKSSSAECATTEMWKPYLHFIKQCAPKSALHLGPFSHHGPLLHGPRRASCRRSTLSLGSWQVRGSQALSLDARLAA